MFRNVYTFSKLIVTMHEQFERILLLFNSRDRLMMLSKC